MPASPLLRFAPSPNGYLHLGHAYSALLTDATARCLGGSWLLRIEDIDHARCKPEFDAAIADDLHWLGLDWPKPVLRQSTRFAAYAEAADRLRGQGLLYPCFCSRRQVADAATATDPDGAPLYPGTCLHLSKAGRQSRLDAGNAPQWRLDMAAAIALAGPLTVSEFDADGEMSTRQAKPAQWGDTVIVRKDTPTSYQLSVVVDDAFQAITHVTRGMDLFHATDLQVLLFALLGLTPPAYHHHALIRDEAALKLAKSRGSESLLDLRAQGWTAELVRRHLGFI